MASAKQSEPRAGQKIVAGLHGVLEALKAGGMKGVEDAYRVHRVKRVPLPAVPAKDIPAIRESVGLTLPMCAAVFGISVRTLRAWENDSKPVPAIALRLLDEMKRNPEYWKLRVRELLA